MPQIKRERIQGHTIQRHSLPCSILATAVTLGSMASLPNAHAAAQLEEVVVTARRVEETAQTVPLAVSSFSAENLRQQGAATLSDVSFHTPNMHFTQSVGNSISPRIAIRGQNQDDIIGTVDASIATYVDGVIWARPIGANFTLSDIERIEVLRGPQGTLFGRNTTGGAIQVFTTDPQFGNSGRLVTTAGNYAQRNVHAMGNGVLIDDKLAVRATYDSQRSDGWQDNTIGDFDQAQQDSQNLSVKALLQASDDLQFLFKVERMESDFTGPGAKMTAAEGAPVILGLDAVAALSGFTDSSANYINDDYRNITDGVKPNTDFSGRGFSLKTTWDISAAVTAQLILARRTLDYSTAFDIDGTPYQILATRTFLDNYAQNSAELLLQGEALDSKLSWTVGFYDFAERGDDGSMTLLPSGSGISNVAFGEIDNSSQALFSQGNYALRDDLTLTLGLRYTEEHKGLDSYNYAGAESDPDTFLYCAIPTSITGNANPFDSTGCQANFERDDNSWNYTFMLSYDISASSMTYFRTGSGFRSGGHNERGGSLVPFDNTVAALASFDSFDPEEVTEYEIGLKSDWFDRRFRSNFALFYSQYENIQRSQLVPTAGGAVATLIQNAAEASLYGLEAELTLALSDNLTAGLNLGVTEASYDKYESLDPGTGAIIDRSDEEFVSTPDRTASVWAQYDLQLAESMVILRTDYSWSSAHTTYAGLRQDGIDTPAQGLLNARATWEYSDALSLALWSTNLTNAEYRVAGLSFYDSYGYGLGIGNEPRRYGLTLDYRF